MNAKSFNISEERVVTSDTGRPYLLFRGPYQGESKAAFASQQKNTWLGISLNTRAPQYDSANTA